MRWTSSAYLVQSLIRNAQASSVREKSLIQKLKLKKTKIALVLIEHAFLHKNIILIQLKKHGLRYNRLEQ